MSRVNSKTEKRDAAPDLPDLESFLLKLQSFSEVNDLLLEGAFKEAAEQFTNVAEFRQLLKSSLKPCYNRRRMPRTPKKLASKPTPRIPVKQNVQVIDFELGLAAEQIETSTVISITGAVLQTPSASARQLSPSRGLGNQLANKSIIGNTQADTSFNRLLPTSTFIPATPSTQRQMASQATQNLSDEAAWSPIFLNARSAVNVPVSASRSAVTMPASVSRPTLRPPGVRPKPLAPNTPKSVSEINRRLEEAADRHNEFVREQQERVARDNEQRKQRVNQNLLLKQQEKERELDERRRHQERVRQFEEAQRSPRTSLKPTNAAAKFLTPGQKAVPQKRNKLNDHQVEVLPKQQVKLAESAYKMTPEKVRQPSIDNVDDLSSVDNEENKENRVGEPSCTPAVSQQQVKLEESVYEMTPDKVFQPSTENDYNVDDLSSADETDNEDNPRKTVPKWAENENLRRDVQKLYRTISKNVVNNFFGVLKPPRLVELFAGGGKKYDALMNETTAWNSPVVDHRSVPLAANKAQFKH